MRVGEAGEHRISLTIGTAGHVDHGKTTLVRYMTGKDTDRLEEEHRRGISIVPGYAELDLPSGRRASLVDVPGHERFRSEEHTSELQSRQYLVCRLLLEKKKTR